MRLILVVSLRHELILNCKVKSFCRSLFKTFCIYPSLCCNKLSALSHITVSHWPKVYGVKFYLLLNENISILSYLIMNVCHCSVNEILTHKRLRALCISTFFNIKTRGGGKCLLVLKIAPLANGVLAPEIIPFFQNPCIRTEEIAFE